MKRIRPVHVSLAEDMEEKLNPFSRMILLRSFDLLSSWLPFSADDLMRWYREKKYDFLRFHVSGRDHMIYALFSLPWLNDQGERIREEKQFDSTAVSLLIGLVFDRQKEVIADLALYHMPAEQMHSVRIRNAFEEESDWLYWETHIVDELCLKDHEPSAKEEVLVYSNAYTAVDHRRKGIFRHLLSLSENFYTDKKSEITLYSVISLDPDVACYGKDRLDHPYIYSMKDEPARECNAMIMEKLGFASLKLETDEEVEDGSLLWFAWKKNTWIDIDP